MTDAELIAAYANDQQRRGLAVGTIAMRTRQLTTFSNDCGSLATVTRQAMEKWLDGRCARDGQPVVMKTRSCWLTSLATFYAWAIREDQLPGSVCVSAKGHGGSHQVTGPKVAKPCGQVFVYNPTAKIIRPRLHKKGPRPIPTHDLERALAAAKGVVKVWISVECFAGARCQEVAYLEREDVDEDNMTLRIVHGKGGIERTVPLHADALEALREHGMPVHGRLFPGVVPSTVSTRINRHLHQLGIRSTAHSLRHWYATEMYRETKDLRQVQELLGHADPATTAIYAAADQSTAAAAVAKLKIGAP